jgi:hypothetical protein
MRVKTTVNKRMMASLAKSTKAGASKKRSHDEAGDASQPSSLPSSFPRLNSANEWKKAKLMTEDLLALVNSGFLCEREIDLWRTTTREYLGLDPNGIFHDSIFVHFCEEFVGIKPHWILF